MEDIQIIQLYRKRDEQAIQETEKKYGGFCYQISYHILENHEDAGECVSDTWLNTWESIPPQNPTSLQAYVGKIVRNISLNVWKKKHAKKRYAGMEMLFSELEECLEDGQSVENQIEMQELTKAINEWLRMLKKEDRNLFLQRYWFGYPVKELANQRKESAKKLSVRLFRLRASLKKNLEKEGFSYVP